MLVLSRKIGQQITIGEGIVIMVVDIRGDKVRLGIEAPRDVRIMRDDATNTEPPTTKEGISS